MKDKANSTFGACFLGGPSGRKAPRWCPAIPFCLPMGGSTHFWMLEMFSVHNEIGTYHFREIGEGRGRGCRADRSRFHRIIWREVAFHFIGNPMLHSIIMTLIAQVCPLPTTPVFSTLTERFVAHSDKRCPVSKSFFTHPSKCYSSSFSITWPFLSAPAQFHLSAVAH